MSKIICAVIFGVIGFYSSALADVDTQLDRGRLGIESRTGCYLVDYSFMETDAIKPGYTRDDRVYDVNKDKSVKEWIFAEEVSPTRIRLQHVLFVTSLDGKLVEGTILKHTGEEWEYNAPFLYDFTGPSNWAVKDLKATPGLWTRRITNLDDGLRYQCAAAWDLTTAYPEWSCDDYAPIPGREYRDFGRKDYNTLQRSSRVISYGANWLERENNIKTIDLNGSRTPLAKEVGKTWYARLPDSECSDAQAFVRPRLAFWSLLRETWDGVFNGEGTFVEKAIPGQSRYADIMAIEEQYRTQNLTDPVIRQAAKDAITKAIQTYRAQ